MNRLLLWFSSRLSIPLHQNETSDKEPRRDRFTLEGLQYETSTTGGRLACDSMSDPFRLAETRF